MPSTRLERVVLDREGLEDLRDRLEEQAARDVAQKTRDARFLERLHTDYGRRRPRADPGVLAGAVRRSLDSLLGGGG